MKVILLENIRKIGSIGDVIDVKRGFARNYLISKNKALFASKKNITEVEKIKKDLSKKDQDRKKAAKEISEKIKPTEISKLLSTQGNVEINSSIIQPVKEIKSLGKFTVIINLHSEIQSTIYINVIAQAE